MIIIRCHSCGFILAKITGKDTMTPVKISVILRQYGYKCPVCMSSLSEKPIKVFVEGKEVVW